MGGCVPFRQANSVIMPSISITSLCSCAELKESSISRLSILGDPGADSGGEEKSKRAGKYDTKKSKERREEPLGTISYQTSSKQSPPFRLLTGQKNTKVFWHQSEARTVATVWNWSGMTLSPGAVLAVLYFIPCPYYLPLGLRGCRLSWSFVN